MSLKNVRWDDILPFKKDSVLKSAPNSVGTLQQITSSQHWPLAKKVWLLSQSFSGTEAFSWFQHSNKKPCQVGKTTRISFKSHEIEKSHQQSHLQGRPANVPCLSISFRNSNLLLQLLHAPNQPSSRAFLQCLEWYHEVIQHHCLGHLNHLRCQVASWCFMVGCWRLHPLFSYTPIHNKRFVQAFATLSRGWLSLELQVYFVRSRPKSLLSFAQMGLVQKVRRSLFPNMCIYIYIHTYSKSHSNQILPLNPT